MQRFVSRLTWYNLPIRVKTALMFASQMVLMGVMALSGFLALDVVRRGMEDVVNLTIEMRTLTHSIQLDVESLQLVETSLVDEYDRPGFDPSTTALPSDYAEVASSLLADTSRLQVLEKELSNPMAAQAFDIRLTEFNSKVDIAQTSFDSTFSLIRQLTTPQTGALAQLQMSGGELQALTLAQGDHELTVHMFSMRSLETALLHTGSQRDLEALQQAITLYQEIYNRNIPPEQQHEELDQLALYQQNVENVGSLLQQLELADTAAHTSLAELRMAASRLSNVTEEYVGTPLAIVGLSIDRTRITLLAVLVVAVAAGAILTALYGRDLARTVRSLLDVAQRLTTGNLRARAEARGEDEFSQLAHSFNAMAVQLEGLIGGLEQRVAERTRDLSITGDIGRAVTALRDPRELMNEIVELIRQRFGFYHAQVFLVDQTGESAVLVASTGTAGRELLARSHMLPVGSPSVIGQVTSRGEPVVASDTDTSTIHRRNELLPDTRSEMALPMRIGDKVIGALDVQSVASNAFDEDDVAVFQIMADQLAIALENAHLHEDIQQLQTTLEALERRVTGEVWQSYRENRSAEAGLAYQISDEQIEPLAAEAPAPINQAIETGKLVSLGDDGEETALAVPIKVRGEVIGAFGFSGESLRNLTPDDMALVEAVIDRVGLALENIRLVEQTTRRAEHEQLVNAITAKIVGSTDVNYILQTTVKELGRVLRAPQTSVQLRPEKPESDHE